MYSSPYSRTRTSPSSSAAKSKGGGGGGNLGQVAPPIKDFIDLIDETRADDWKKRTDAVFTLLDQIPRDADIEGLPTPWHHQPPTLRQLARPFSELLRDARSTVVKRTCDGLSQLFGLCQSNARYLLKDLMPTILAVHAQTVQVIRTYVQDMVEEAIPIVPCKMAMPIWLDRLKVEKSRTVRDACVLYLGLGLEHWNEPGYLSDENLIQVGTALIKTLRDPSPSVRKNAREGLEKMRNLYPILWDRLVKDPLGPAAKDHRLQQWLLKATEGGAGTGGGKRNAKGGGADDDNTVEDYSIASRYSNFTMGTLTRNKNSTPGGGGRRSSGGGKPSYQQTSLLGQARNSFNDSGHIPTSIQVSTPAPAPAPKPVQASTPRGTGLARRTTGRTSGLGPPQRRIVPPSQSKQQESPKAPPYNYYGHNANATTKSTSPADNDSLVAMNTPQVSSDQYDYPSSSRRRQAPTPEAAYGGGITPTNSGEMISPQNNTMNTTNTSISTVQPGITTPNDVTDSPFMSSMNELKEHAAKQTTETKNTNNTTVNGKTPRMLKERLRSSLLGSSARGGLSAVNGEGADGAGGGIEIVSQPPQQPVLIHDTNNYNKNNNHNTNEDDNRLEHIIIAQQLLKAHKDHIDTIMETLKIEMDALRNFETAFKEQELNAIQNGRNATNMPTEEQVLDYFESCASCLDKRTLAGNILLREMDRISRGEI